jgi:hypothetical protein
MSASRTAGLSRFGGVDHLHDRGLPGARLVRVPCPFPKPPETGTPFETETGWAVMKKAGCDVTVAEPTGGGFDDRDDRSNGERIRRFAAPRPASDPYVLAGPLLAGYGIAAGRGVPVAPLPEAVDFVRARSSGTVCEQFPPGADTALMGVGARRGRGR